MKKNTKHQFKHPDPEKNVPTDPKKAVAKQKETYSIENYSLIQQDLKKTILTITAFVTLVVAAYFLQEKYNWIEIVKSSLA